MQSDKEFYTAKEAAEYLDYHVDTVREMLRAGTLTGDKLGPHKNWRIHKHILVDIKDKLAAKKPEKGKTELRDYVEQKELERFKRIKSTLKFFKNVLGEWVFRYAYSLSGKFPPQVGGTAVFRSQDFNTHLHELDIVFGGADWDRRKIRPPDRTKEEKIMAFPIDADDVRYCLEKGTEQVIRIEERISEFPEILNLVSDRASRIKRITKLIKERIQLLEEWKEQQEIIGDDSGTIDSSPINHSIRVDLRCLGSRAVDVLIGVDEELQRLESIEVDKSIN